MISSKCEYEYGNEYEHEYEDGSFATAKEHILMFSFTRVRNT